MAIGVVIPTHNEEENIGKVIEEVRNCGNYKIVVVDDGSDRTAEIAKGEGGAIYAGLESLLKEGDVDYIAIMDGDGQDDPIYISRAVEILEKNERVGLVTGGAKKKGMPSKVMNSIRRTNINWGCGFRVIRREVAEDIVEDPFRKLYNGFSSDIFIIQKALEKYNIEGIEYKRRHRSYGGSKFNFQEMLYALPSLLKIISLRQGDKNENI
jgi:glycosyltransferase involved in cell wall biosynthesis